MSPVALDPEESVRAELDGARLYDVSYASAGGGRVSGWMVVPEASGPHPAIVYVHGSETDRDDFLDEAIAMANGGAVALTLNAPFARAGNDRTGTLGNYFTPGAEAALNQQMLDDVSAAFDLLSARPDVDPQRLAFVGHSWGASLGAVLAARDPRSIANVLITPRPSWTGLLRRSEDDFAGVISTVGDDGWEAYLASMEPYDAVPAVSIADGGIYLQFGTQDDVVIASDVDEWVAAAPEGTRIDRYPAGHALDATRSPIARRGSSNAWASSRSARMRSRPSGCPTRRQSSHRPSGPSGGRRSRRVAFAEWRPRLCRRTFGIMRA